MQEHRFYPKAFARRLSQKNRSIQVSTFEQNPQNDFLTNYKRKETYAFLVIKKLKKREATERDRQTENERERERNEKHFRETLE